MVRLRLANALVASSGVLVACGGNSDTSDSGDGSSSGSTAAVSSAAPATGDLQSSGEFSFSAPKGWEAQEGQAQAILSAADVKDTDGFADNLNVVSDDTIARIDDVDDLGKAAKAGLENAHAREVSVGDPIQLDGETAAMVTSLFALNNVDYRTLQYMVRHGGKGYVVTFSYSKDRPAAEQQQVAESVAVTWKWAS